MTDHDKTIRVRGPAPTLPSAPQRPCLTVLYGGPVGLVYTLLAGTETVIGRGMEADIPVVEQRVSRRHAVINVSEKGKVVVEDQGSSNGTYVNGTRVRKQALKDGDRVQIGYSCIIKFSYQDDLEYQLQKEIAGGTKDPTTGLYTNKYFKDRINAEFTYALRRDQHLGVLIFGIDHFEKISLAHGQITGEQVLKDIAHAVSPILRAGDIFARFDVERFAVLARDLDDASSVILAQRIRKIVRDHKFEIDGTRIKVTVSIGIATLADKPTKPKDLIKIATESLRETKWEAGQDGIGGAAVSTYLKGNEDTVTVHYQPGGKA
ncbi:MAG: diguanylate cyclase domain-containing protein [Acidiferrobacterales bacterium]